jgi:hypothetical protein
MNVSGPFAQRVRWATATLSFVAGGYCAVVAYGHAWAASFPQNPRRELKLMWVERFRGSLVDFY